jgi:hypothetical protein
MKIIIYIVIPLILNSCIGNKNIVAANYTYNTECMGVEGDGSLTLLAWGNGRNRADAVEQAKKNAVMDVIFKGIRNGKDDCNKIPLINEPNARDKYESYFNDFFKDNGVYKKFVSSKDERIGDKVTRDRMKSDKSVTNSCVVKILRYQLKEQLIKDQILKN